MACYSRRGTRGGVEGRYIPVYQRTGHYRQVVGEKRVRARRFGDLERINDRNFSLRLSSAV